MKSEIKTLKTTDCSTSIVKKSERNFCYNATEIRWIEYYSPRNRKLSDPAQVLDLSFDLFLGELYLS